MLARALLLTACVHGLDLSSNVVELTTSNFGKTSEGLWLLEFCAASHARLMRPPHTRAPQPSHEFCVPPSSSVRNTRVRSRTELEEEPSHPPAPTAAALPHSPPPTPPCADAPWCGHCKKLAPTYERVATYFAEAKRGSGVNVAKIDATEHPGLAGRFDVKGYPTLR